MRVLEFSFELQDIEERLTKMINALDLESLERKDLKKSRDKIRTVKDRFLSSVKPFLSVITH